MKKREEHDIKLKHSAGKHASKSRQAAEARRNRLIEAALNGENLEKVAIETGLSPKTASSQASQILRHPKAQESFVQILEERGLTDDFLAEKARELLEAKTMHYFTKDGVVTDERAAPASETRRKTLELVARMKGHLKDNDKDKDINFGLMQVVVQAINMVDQGDT